MNAKDAMAGVGTLTIETSDVPDDIDDVHSLAGSCVRMTVRDAGCGMNKEILAQVFEPFFTTKPDGRGTGLGLSQVYGFVQQSGGHIRIESEAGEGTSVHLFSAACAEAVTKLCRDRFALGMAEVTWPVRQSNPVERHNGWLAAALEIGCRGYTGFSPFILFSPGRATVYYRRLVRYHLLSGLTMECLGR
ncbi:ATP-binding protein [Mesorhizobium sp. M1148]|uniref:sensor histidine kinase n=1 Tax=unclassified Mesorhizobium TaxID=325217 RepID=UPI0033375E4F